MLPRAWQTVPLLKISFVTIWIMAILGWFAEDSGVGVPGSTLPFVLPLAISIVAAAALADDKAPTEPTAAPTEPTAAPTEPAASPAEPAGPHAAANRTATGGAGHPLDD